MVGEYSPGLNNIQQSDLLLPNAPSFPRGPRKVFDFP